LKAYAVSQSASVNASTVNHLAGKTDIIKRGRPTPASIGNDEIETTKFLIGFFDEIEATVSAAYIRLDRNAAVGKSFQSFLSSRGIGSIVYGDDEVVMRRQSAGDDQTKTCTS
jgi:hypothetical protein